MHSGLPLRAKAGIYFPSAILLAPRLAGACWNPFWVYFRLKLARVRRFKKMAVFFTVKGPIFGRFSPNLAPQTPNFHENSEHPRFGRLLGPFAGGKNLEPREKKIAEFGASGASRGPPTGVGRPNLGTGQPPRPRRVFRRQKLPARLK